MEKVPKISNGANQKLTKKSAQDLMEIEGEARGVTFKTDFQYILKEKGEKGVKKLEEKLKEVNCPIDYKKIDTLAFYPLGLRIVSLIAIKEVFNFDEKKIEEMGRYAPKISLIVKLLLKYFISPKKAIMKETPRGWRKHYTLGELEPVEYNEEKKYFRVRIKNFKILPLYCCYYLKGYFCGVIEMLTGASGVTGENKKCVFKGDKYHEYLIKWQ